MIYDYEKEKQRNMEEIENMTIDKPFKDANIRKFYEKHRSGEHPFIPVGLPHYRGCHDAIYELLSFLDKHGGTVFFVNFKTGITLDPTTDHTEKEITLRNHVLNVAENILKLNDNRLQDPYIDIHMFLCGITALSANIGLGYGKDYMQWFNFNYCEASLAALENIPQIFHLPNYHRIRDILRLYYIYDYRAYFTQQKLLNNTSFRDDGIATMLYNAEMQVRRQEIFEYATHNPFFKACTDQTMENIVNIAKRTVNDNNKPYLDEIEGLKKNRDKLRSKDKIKNKIITAYEKGDTRAVKQYKRDLITLEEQFGKSKPK